jgi:transposase-like protein
MAKKMVWRRSNDFRRMAVERFNSCENIVALAKELGIQRPAALQVERGF